MAGGGAIVDAPKVAYLTGKALIWPIALISSLFFLWGFSYGLLDVLNKHFQTVLNITKLQSTGLQVAYFGGGYFCFSPVAAEVLRRRGYKFTVLMGLSLYALGAILFWPCAQASVNGSNPSSVFGGFVVCTFVIACGLSSLETAANSYASVIGAPEQSAVLLQFCQSWNGVASFVGPLIAADTFFTGANQNSLGSVRFVYLAVALAGIAVGIVFFFTKLPEVEEKALQATIEAEGEVSTNYATMRPFWKQYNAIFAFVAQFCYSGSQITIASFFLNYATENAPFSSATASNLLSYALITFTVARFIGTVMLRYVAADIALVVFSGMCIVCMALASGLQGTAGVAMIIVCYAFESIQYPIIFVLGTENLGRHTRRAAGLLVQGVGGGALFPPIQGAIADAYSTRISYLVPMFGFIYVFGYATYHWVFTSKCEFRAKTVSKAAPLSSDNNSIEKPAVAETEVVGERVV